MIKIGIIAPKESRSKLLTLQIFQKLRETYGTTGFELVTGGSDGIEKQFKKIVLETIVTYKEFNPSFSDYNSFSALSENYYGKNWHPTHDSDRYRRMIRYCDRLIFFTDQTDKEVNAYIRYAEKIGKKFAEVKI